MRLRHLHILAIVPLAVGTATAQTSPAPASPAIVTVGAQLILDGVADVAGGVDRDTRVLARLDGTAQIDGTGFGADWLAARADIGVMNGRRASEGLAGDIQGVDNIEGVRAFRIHNAWVRANVGSGGIQAGVIDLNSQFDIHNVSAPLINSSFGTGPSLSQSGLNGPSIYPNSGLGVVAWADDTDRALRVRVGLFDGLPNNPDAPARTTLRLSAREGALAIGEVTKTWGPHGRLVIGAWGYTARLPRLRAPDRSDRGSIGGYVTVEDTLVRFGDGRRLDGWVRGGLADRRFDIISAYMGGGAVLHGVARANSSDAIGFGIANADLSRAKAIESGGVVGTDTPGSGTETTVELSYQRPFGDHLTVQPDVQYVVSPGGRNDRADALVLILRFIVTTG